ncbi:MAG: hypothetical protein KDC87_10785 [Planctomycetes bacterium]|nr:hypothetical protein [Planctomycetota bacterium]MCB9870106.1 hypothetical protein [Planctomycetota bacterium]
MRLRSSLFLLVLCGSTLAAQTITVNTSADVIDIDPNTGTVSSLPGPDGKVSFSEAMIAANNTPGPQTIGFAIPRSEWILQSVFPGRAVITSSVGFYFRAFDQVTIDGTTQTAFTGDTNPNGAEVLFYRNEVYLNANGCVLTGVDGSSFTITGSNCSVYRNTGGMNVSVFGGRACLIRDNECGTIKIDRSDDNVIIGNVASRVRVLGGGSTALVRNNRVGGPTLAERNYLIGYGTYSSEGMPSGTVVQLFATSGTLIQNNWIGTTRDGMSSGNQASTIGIGFEGDNQAVVVRDNLIAGILGRGQAPHYAGLVFGWAVYFTGSANGVSLLGNTIGLDAQGAPSLGSVWGIDVGYASRTAIRDIRIGGPGAGEGNVIAGHRLNGVTVGYRSSGVRLQGNSIYGNGGIGIDLIPTSAPNIGVTPNDAGDGDAGGNGVQNYPVITSAAVEGSSLRVRGTLNSAASQSFVVEVFASPSCSTSGFGEGRQALGVQRLTTDASGNASFDMRVPSTAPVGWVATATATAELDGSTSEFSACAQITTARATFQSYGSACAGSVGLLDQRSNSLPTLGNQSFALSVHGARPATLALLFVSLRAVNQPLQGCAVLVDPTAVVFSTQGTTDALGSAAAGLAIPLDPALAGARVYSQWFNQDSASTNLGVIGGGAATQGAEIVLGS